MPSQVSNQADCIKIACDFLHPNSVRTCEEIAKRFRTETLTNSSVHEDILQTSLTLLFTFQTIHEKCLALPSNETQFMTKVGHFLLTIIVQLTHLCKQSLQHGKTNDTTALPVAEDSEPSSPMDQDTGAVNSAVPIAEDSEPPSPMDQDSFNFEDTGSVKSVF